MEAREVLIAILKHHVMQRQSVAYKGTFTVLRHRLQQMYEQVEAVAKAESPSVKVHGNLTVSHEGADYVVLQWVSDPISDMVADSVVAMI